jgi:hypothetical protein
MILTITLSVLLSFFVLLSAIMGFRLITLRNDLAEFALRAALLEQGVKKALDTSPSIENSEGFLRFVSESRDWAFQYIEEVQTALQEFTTDIEPEIAYFKEYGDIASMSPNYYSMKKISAAYDKLKEVLPKEI